MAAATNTFKDMGQDLTRALDDKRNSDLRRLFQNFCVALDDLASDINTLKTASAASTLSPESFRQTASRSSTVRSSQQQAQTQLTASRSSGNSQSNLTDDSGAYGLWSGMVASGENVGPGAAVTKTATGIYLARSTDASYPCTHIAVQADGQGGMMCRSGGTAQCLRLLPGSTEGPMYLSTVPGYLTDNPAESVGGTRVVFQRIGTFERTVTTTIGATGICLVSLSIGEPANA